MCACVRLFNQPLQSRVSSGCSALDLEVMSFSHTTSSPTWQHKFYCAEKTLGFERFIKKSSEL